MFKDRLLIGASVGPTVPVVGVRNDTSFVTRAMLTGNCTLANFQFVGTATAVPVADVSVEETDDTESVRLDLLNGTTLATWTTRTIVAGTVDGLTADTTLAAGPPTVVHWAGAANTNFIIRLADPAAAVRLRYTRTGGGGNNNTIFVRGFCRGLT